MESTYLLRQLSHLVAKHKHKPIHWNLDVPFMHGLCLKQLNVTLEKAFFYYYFVLLIKAESEAKEKVLERTEPPGHPRQNVIIFVHDHESKD